MPDAIVRLIVHPKPRVRVTAAGSMIVAQRFMPRQVSRA